MFLSHLTDNVIAHQSIPRSVRRCGHQQQPMGHHNTSAIPSPSPRSTDYYQHVSFNTTRLRHRRQDGLTGQHRYHQPRQSSFRWPSRRQPRQPLAGQSIAMSGWSGFHRDFFTIPLMGQMPFANISPFPQSLLQYHNISYAATPFFARLPPPPFEPPPPPPPERAAARRT